MKPSDEQEDIINYNGSIVVIAQPGSGKTFTLSEKIKKILYDLPEFRGIIAISFTRKASKELEKRSLEGGLHQKGSFFGTMDKFYISEIIFPFGRHIFGRPSKELEIIEINHTVIKEMKGSVQIEDFNQWFKNNIDFVKTLYLKGYVLLESVPIFALFILNKSKSSREYLKARYSYIIIDEYQDCSREQHALFLMLKRIGINGIAVGDINQSIFGFANKSAEYLIDMAKNTDFKLFRLSKNHRCHPSIINYSLKLISENHSDFVAVDQNRVFSKKINGDEKEIAIWLDSAIPLTMEHFGVTDFNEVGILVRGKRTGKIINESLNLKHKFFDGTPFDNDSSLWGTVFESILVFVFNKKNNTKYEFVETFLNVDTQYRESKEIIKTLEKLAYLSEFGVPLDMLENFLSIANIIYPNAENSNAVNILKMVLNDKNLLDKFHPAQSDEVQIMTLHKSKGLEFQIVFHLDLYEYIFPQKYNGVYTDYDQDLNLHYVGITRAKKCCVLCTSTVRHNSENIEKVGRNSDFLNLVRLAPLRDDFYY